MLPIIGTKGLFTFKAPFNTEDYQVELKVIAIRSFQDLSAEGIDVENLIYKKASLTSSDFEKDEKNDELIVIFSDTSNRIYRIPTSYITNTPVTDGSVFENLYISIPLGYLPKGYILDTLLSEVKDSVLKNLGVKTTPVLINANRDKIVPIDKKREFEARVSSNRTARNYIPYEEKIADLENKLQVANKTITDLQSFLSKRYSEVVITDNRPNDEDLKSYTKKIRIEVKSKDSPIEAVIRGLSFYIYNRYNLNPIETYLTRMTQYVNDENKFTCKLGDIEGSLILTQGELTDGSNLSRMFSRLDYSKFKTGISIVELTFNSEINIRGYKLYPNDGFQLFSKTIQLTFFNKENRILFIGRDEAIERVESKIERKDINLVPDSLPENPLS